MTTGQVYRYTHFVWILFLDDQLEPLAFQWMMRMDDFKSTVGTVGMRCSRQTWPMVGMSACT